RHKDINIFQPAYKVDAVDTTAAGDTFTGYFIALRQQGKSIEESLQKASKASSITVSRKGASISIPKIAEVD
ncbi:PfkB family carbohydrate kinase, partial [Megamonas funiformis]